MAEALAWAEHGRGRMHELFTVDAGNDLAERARRAGVAVSHVTERAAAGLSETVTPQGIVAVCDLVTVPLTEALQQGGRLVAVCVGTADPGNAGTLIRVADAAGADAVIFAGEGVDPHNGKAVRASTGSLFHLPIARIPEPHDAITACRGAGLRLLAADGHARDDLNVVDLGVPTAWLFGNEAHGLAAGVLDAADAAVRVPIYGAAESLNLATAAAVCLYSSARAQHPLRTEPDTACVARGTIT